MEWDFDVGWRDECDSGGKAFVERTELDEEYY
jgi:hypothetical protein